MKKGIKIFIVIMIILLILLTSCNKGNSDNNVIQLWYYNFEKEENASERLATKIEIYCEKENIPLKIFKYDKNIMSYQDYAFKRNVAAASGNLITIDDARNLISISEDHADYIKLANYDNLFNIYKDRFCIPIGINYWVISTNNDAMEHYGIDTSKNRVITYSEYLDRKQIMKEKGARFALNNRDRYEMIDYCLNSNGLLFVDKNNSDIKSADKFSKMIKKTIFDICENIKLYSEGTLSTDKGYVQSFAQDYHIYDKMSNLNLSDAEEMTPIIITRYLFKEVEDIYNKTLVIHPRLMIYSPSLYVSNKVTNDKVYDVASFIISFSNYSMLIHENLTPKTALTPTLDTAETREMLQVNENWEYVIRANEPIEIEESCVINEIYSLIIKDENTSKELADYYFSNPYYNTNDDNYRIAIRDFIEDTIIDMARELSGGNLSLEKFDPESEEINKNLYKKIKEFVKNFYLLYY